MAYLLPIFMLLIGLLLGSGFVWLLLKAKIQHSFERAKSESETERATLAERVQSREMSLTQKSEELSARSEEIRELNLTVNDQKGKISQLAQALQDERKQTQEKLAVLEDAEKKLSDSFKALSLDALKSNNESFLKLAKENLEKFQETAKGDLEKRQQAIDSLMKPVEKSLKKVDEKLLDIESKRLEAYSGLKEQVKMLADSQKELRTETANLVKALRRPDVRGRWGEIQLKRVVEMAGMLNHCDFFEQKSVETEDGQLRPDLLVQLPGNKMIVVDSKVPLTAFLAATEATDEKTRIDRLKDHARHVRNHIQALGKKSYFSQFDNSPEFVVLFLPGEVFFSAALEHDPSLIEMGVEQNVIVATPTTLIALLKAVSYGWRQELIAQNAKEISDLGRELYERLATMGSHMIKLGRNLNSATASYNQAVGALESRVLVSARKFKDLGSIGVGNEIEELSSLEKVPRELQSPELSGESVIDKPKYLPE